MLTAAYLNQQVKEITKLSELELRLIAEERWQDVEDTDRQRQQKIRHTFEQQIPDSLADVVRRAIEQLTLLENEIRTLTENARVKTAQELRRLGKGNKATGSYNKTGLL